MLQVALLCGLDDNAKKALLKDPLEGGIHLHKLLKFLTVRSEEGEKRSGITLLGGTVSPLVDGNPGRYSTCLNTGICEARQPRKLAAVFAVLADKLLAQQSLCHDATRSLALSRPLAAASFVTQQKIP